MVTGSTMSDLRANREGFLNSNCVRGGSSTSHDRHDDRDLGTNVRQPIVIARTGSNRAFHPTEKRQLRTQQDR